MSGHCQSHFLPDMVDGQVVGLVEQLVDISPLRASKSTIDGLVLERDALRAKTAQLDQALINARKLAMLGMLAGGIAHDFNNVLASVSGSLQLLKITASEQRSQESVDRGLRGVDRAHPTGTPTDGAGPGAIVR